QLEDRIDYHEELPRLQRHLKKLKWKAYKGLLWALKMDHQKINWELELAIEEIKKALAIPQEEHNKIVQELENDFRQIDVEANRRAGVYGDAFEMEIHEDEGKNSKCYNQSIVGEYAWIKWAADGKFRKVLIIDYDLENGAHELLHVEEKLYEWLNLNELLSEDIQWECPQEYNDKNVNSQETIYLYEHSQLMGMVEQVLSEPADPSLLDEALKYSEEQKRLVDMALEAVANKIGQLTDQNEPENEEFYGNDNDRDGSGNQEDEEKLVAEETKEEGLEEIGEDVGGDDRIKSVDSECNVDSDGNNHDSGGDSTMSGDSSSDQSGDTDDSSSDSDD
ncbi:hypothetical protein KI387_009845, partial [Taxus chinensis]